MHHYSESSSHECSVVFQSMFIHNTDMIEYSDVPADVGRFVYYSPNEAIKQ